MQTVGNSLRQTTQFFQQVILKGKNEIQWDLKDLWTICDIFVSWFKQIIFKLDNNFRKYEKVGW